jgi:hypothetical protein
MKNFIIYILLLVSLISITVLLVFYQRGQTLPTIKYAQDNVDLEFTYPIDWQIKTEGDLVDRYSDKYLVLENKIYQQSIVIHLFYDIPSNTKSLCEQYNDCGLVNEQKSAYTYQSEQFTKLPIKATTLMISKTGGIDFAWDANQQHSLIAGKPQIANSYYVYNLKDAKLSQIIPINDKQHLFAEVSYQFDNTFTESAFINLKQEISDLLGQIMR